MRSASASSSRAFPASICRTIPRIWSRISEYRRAFAACRFSEPSCFSTSTTMSFTRDKFTFDDSSFASASRFFVLNFVTPSRFFDNCPPLQRLRRKNQPDAPLLDNRVRVRPQSHAHKHLLNIAQPRHSSVDQILALPRAVQPPANHHFARLHRQNRLLRRLLPPLPLDKLRLRCRPFSYLR